MVEYGWHPSTDAIQAYCLRHASDEEIAAIELHLFDCEDCSRQVAITVGVNWNMSEAGETETGTRGGRDCEGRQK